MAERVDNNDNTRQADGLPSLVSNMSDHVRSSDHPIIKFTVFA
jgi:hypothetical protein